jgi:hypothetical protein
MVYDDSRRRSASRRSTGQHAFVMGLLLTAPVKWAN